MLTAARQLKTILLSLLIRNNPSRLPELSTWLKTEKDAADLLRQHGLDIIAYELLAAPQLEQRYRLAVVTRLANEQVHQQVLLSLAHGGYPIPVIVQKGAWLAPTVYSVAHWRPYADLDLLVPDDCLQEIDSRLRALKFRPLYSALPGRTTLPDWVDQHVRQYRRPRRFTDSG